MLGLLFLCVFIAVLLGTLIVIDLVDRGLRHYEQRFLSRGMHSLGEMFIFVDRRQVLLLTIGAALLLGLLGYLIFHWFIALALVATGLLSPLAVIKKLRERRVQAFDRQLGDAMTQMAAALRAGLTLVQAAENIAQEASAPLGDEFRLLVREIKLGVAQDKALLNMADRVGSESVQLTVTATNVARQLGANLAEMYDGIAGTIRDRFQIESRVRALTSMGRMQAWVVGLMPAFVGVAFYFMRPDLMEPMLDAMFGKVLVLGVIGMEVIGMWLIRRMIHIEV